MKDELSQLTNATSVDLVPGKQGDPEDASLAEGWSVLRQLVAQADAGREFDEAAFLTSLSQATLQRPVHSQRVRWLVLGALAASLLICLAAGSYIARQRWGSQTSVAQGIQPATSSDLQGSATASAVDAATANELSWEDSLDDAITSAHETLFQLRSGVSYSSSLERLGDQLEQMGNEIESGSL